jgi:hypothetical protein
MGMYFLELSIIASIALQVKHSVTANIALAQSLEKIGGCHLVFLLGGRLKRPTAAVPDGVVLNLPAPLPAASGSYYGLSVTVPVGTWV